MTDRFDAESAQPPTSRPGWTLFALAFAGLCASFMQTLLVPLQGDLPELLGAPLSVTAWAVTITQLISAVWMPIAGRLADMYGKRRVMMWMLVLLIVGSLLAALAANVWILLVARGIQGAGFGVIVIGISLLRDVMPPHRLATSIAVVSATLGVGGALGLPLSAIVAQNLDWHAVFWLASFLSAIALLLAYFLVPASAIRTGGRVDWLGMIGLTIGTTALLLLISNGSAWAPGLALTVAVIALAVFVAWSWYELRVPLPLVDLRINSAAPVLLTNLTGLTMGFALFAPQVAFPQLLTLSHEFGGLSFTPIQASLVVMPMGLAMLAMSPLAGRLERSWGSKFIVMSGALLMAAGYIMAMLATPSLWSLLAAAIVIGSGTGLGYAAMPALIMSAVPPSETGSANGLNALMRSLGTALAASIVTGVLTATSVTIGGATAPAAAGFDWVFGIATAASLACAVLAAFIPRTGRAGGLSRQV